MRIKEQQAYGIIGREISLNIAELIVLADLSKKLEDLSNKRFIKLSSDEEQTIKDVKTFVAKLSDKVVGIEDAKISLFSEKHETESVTDFNVKDDMKDIIDASLSVEEYKDNQIDI